MPLLALLGVCQIVNCVVLFSCFWKAHTSLSAQEDSLLGFINQELQTDMLSPARPADLPTALGQLSLRLSDTRTKLRELVERAIDVICIIDTEGRITSINAACDNVLGYSKDELQNRSIRILFESEEADRLLASFLGHVESIDKVVFESKVRRKDGTLIDVIWTGHWSASERGFFCIIHDVTAQKQLERLKAEFVSMISHDLRAPLASVESTLGLMELGVLGQITDKGAHLAAITRRQCQQMLQLLNSMLDLDRLDAGAFQLQSEEIQLSPAVEHAIATVSQSAGAKNISITCQHSPATVWSDELRLTQVLVNLLTNAIKFAPENSEVQVTCTDDRDFVRIEVTDSGCGIPEDKQDSIFDRFEQLGKTQRHDNAGFGLGLAICKAIVQQHGGEIGVRSALGQGSTFWFTIPTRSASPALPEASPRHPAPTA